MFPPNNAYNIEIYFVEILYLEVKEFFCIHPELQWYTVSELYWLSFIFGGFLSTQQQDISKNVGKATNLFHEFISFETQTVNDYFDDIYIGFDYPSGKIDGINSWRV